MKVDAIESTETPFKGWYLFFCGVCMGAADLVPCISGGTLAFIFGFYQPLLDSLQTFNATAFRHFLCGRWRALSEQLAWRFLFTLLAGILVAFICFANAFHYILSHELYRIYLYALFLGFILASFVMCAKQIEKWSWGIISGMAIGVISAFLLTGTIFAPQSSVVILYPISFFNGWLIFCGVLAACALLLPGISGSYILTLLGVYPTIIEALVEFLNGLVLGKFNTEAFAILLSLGVGVVGGALGCARLLGALLRTFPQMSLAVLSGFMIGAIRSVWPFWTYDYKLIPHKLHKGLQLVPQEPYIPSFDVLFTWQVFFFTFIGFIFVYALGKKQYVKISRVQVQ